MSKIKRGSREQHWAPWPLWSPLTTEGKHSGINSYFPRKVLNWPYSAPAQKVTFASEGSTSNSQKFPREQELILCLLHLVSYFITQASLLYAPYIVLQQSSNILKCLERKEVLVSVETSRLFQARFANSFASPALHFLKLHKKNTWSCIDQPSATQAGGHKKEHLNTFLFLFHPWEKCDCYWI